MTVLMEKCGEPDIETGITAEDLVGGFMADIISDRETAYYALRLLHKQGAIIYRKSKPQVRRHSVIIPQQTYDLIASHLAQQEYHE